MKCPGSGRLEKERKKETTEADEGPEVLKERRQRELAGRGGAGASLLPPALGSPE